MGVTNLADEIRQIGQEFFARLDDGHATLDAWRDRARAAYEEVEAREATDVGTEESTGVPEGAPPQYDAVRARVEDGDYSWYDVMSADVTDPDARQVHMWLDSRINLISRAWLEMERGASADEAVDAVSADIERERRLRG
jgi:hypothetical protein